MISRAAKVNLRNEPNFDGGVSTRHAAESRAHFTRRGLRRLEIRRITYRFVMLFRPGALRHDIGTSLCEARPLT